ncbi:MAG TPA: hypothetical protein VMH39_03230 [Gemmatimonadaceae bacterium]|nr:hypothetical protein [Gemmatimonadaceae bacterium]
MPAATDSISATRTGVRGPRPQRKRPGRSTPPVQRTDRWIVGPWFDLAFFANLTWPIFALLWGAGVYFSADPAHPNTPINFTVGIWALFLLATPHRWITPMLVFLDGDRFKQRPNAYVGLFVLFLALTLTFVSLDLVVLLLIMDWIWNAWHFAAQHSGISRIYGRVVNPADKSSGMFEKVVLRMFVVYVILRLGGAPVMGLDRERWLWWLDKALPYFRFADYPMLLLPVILLAREARGLSRASLGRFVYLSSICLLYSAIVVTVHMPHSKINVGMAEGLIFAIGIVHSTEYLAIVSWSVKKRFATSTHGVFSYLAPRWGMALGIFAFALGFGGLMMHLHYERAWVIVTLFVSYLHYGYDGMIWKVRRPATAAVA